MTPAAMDGTWPVGWSVPRSISPSTLPSGPCPSAMAMRALAFGYRSTVLPPPRAGSLVAGPPAVADGDDEAWGGDEGAVLGCTCPPDDPDLDEGRWIDAERERVGATFDPTTGEPRPGTWDCGCVEGRGPIGRGPEWRPFPASREAEDEAGPLLSADPGDLLQDP